MDDTVNHADFVEKVKNVFGFIPKKWSRSMF